MGRAIALILLVSGLLTCLWWHGHYSGYAERVAEEFKDTSKRQDVVITRQAEVIAVNQAKDDKAEKVEAHAQAARKDLAPDLARAVAERDRLRDALDQLRADTLSQGAADPDLPAKARAVADSLSECSASYTALAGERDELAIQVDWLLKVTEPTGIYSDEQPPPVSASD